MECSTILTIDGFQYAKPKAKYKDIKKANKVADKSNRKRTAIWMSVVYKCSECGFFHVGRDKTRRVNKEEIRKPQKPKKVLKEYVPKTEIKILGKIELAKTIK